MKNAVAFAPLLLLAVAVQAQRPPSPAREAQMAAMQQLSFLIGHWEGTGWYDYGGRRMDVRSTEIVEARLDSLLLIVEGRHYADIPGQPEPVMVHHAFGLLSYDSDAGQYAFRTHLAEGQGGTFEAHWEGDALVWTMDHPQMGHVRYTITLNEQGQWHEVGHRSEDGETWTPFFGMTLDRTGDAR